MVNALTKNGFTPRKGPVVLVIMDGVGYGKYEQGDAVASSLTPYLDTFHATCPVVPLKAHGKAVGLPSDEDMGNSEVGHNAIGAGRVFAQGAKLVSNAIATGAMFEGDTWKEITANVREKNSALHFIGLFSDGNVHSHIDHLKAMLVRAAKDEGVKKARLHILLDGRDVGETSALEYVDPFEAFLAELNSAHGVDFRIASGGGRMNITMDRYGADWSMVERGWLTHVKGKGPRYASARDAITDIRRQTGAIDQDLGPFVIAENGQPVGPVRDGDSVVFFNFRGDRAQEITAAFEQDNLPQFERGDRPDVCYAGMMEYDGDLHVPKKYLVAPPSIDRTVGQYLCASGVRSMAISETQKYGHVTYFYNGNNSGYINESLEKYVEVTSDILPFEQRPWMKAADITDAVLKAIKSGEFDFIRLNFANGDMVGHTGVYQAVQIAVETVDLQLGRLKKAIDAVGGVMVISADHGNADDMYEHDKKTGAVKVENGVKKVKTAHSLNPVPCVIYDPSYHGEYAGELKKGLGISSLAATCIELLGFTAPEDYDPSVFNWR
ncbi:MAG: 2,3-bisphosphoglycerate-independent phosphoglycerate mutase [Lentisphaeria bacterium]|nr:2,3-bisphosphoglycerate-independent phosphoglycerate mutase [Lentisphaeria bacterium]